MKFVGVDHIDMIVKDLSKSIEYYRKFGMQVEGTVDNGKTVFLWNGDSDHPVRIELHQQREGETLGIDHLSFQVDDPVQAQKEVEFLGGVDFRLNPLKMSNQAELFQIATTRMVYKFKWHVKPEQARTKTGNNPPCPKNSHLVHFVAQQKRL